MTPPICWASVLLYGLLHNSIYLLVPNCKRFKLQVKAFLIKHPTTSKLNVIKMAILNVNTMPGTYLYIERACLVTW